MNPKQKYLCHECEKSCDSEQEAHDCCELETYWKCGNCAFEYETEKEAEKCCQAYQCSGCGLEYDTEEEADECSCQDIDGESE